ncbi:cation:proton antiporter domain-containing protein [Prosthecobacter dejongeii]|uniref:CPA2 family monovalent cation:H+ antiporter-2 n=1 Tax=Prosthecobacter dejongeii TaxID=48465 RepID=A0A7W8DRJ8_9BACT|nr:cation:proton antiporter [Prosthecobacter dejongeii]MBB5039527.1 CPA2 family monovalent cation:H+ antiporter-2 [Prosthecobacter dejongeii]
MHHIIFLQDLAVVMIIAAVVTILFRQMKQPVVLGYILAGVIIGPHTPPYALIEDKHTIETLSELGVIFLMFSLGLEFSLKKLTKVGATALIAASAEIVLMIWAGYQLGQAFGWGTMDSVFLGAILSISSTTIIIKALEEIGKTKERFAQMIFGILIVEDILAILMIAMLSGFATTGSLALGEVALTVGKLSTFLGVLLILGLILVPRLLNWVAKFKSDEMLLVTVIGLCFGVSLLAVKLGYSVALGAFIIGAIIAEARHIAHIEKLMHPVRDLFSAVFFVSIGLLIDPQVLKDQWAAILIITAVVVVGKVLSCGLGTFVSGNDMKTSMRVGMGLAQIGEFSFIIAALGLSLKVTSDFLYPTAVAVSALTTLLTPYLIRSSDAAVKGLTFITPKGLMNSLDAYTNWVGKLGTGGGKQSAAGFLRKWGWQILLNIILIAGVFITAAFMKEHVEKAWPDAPGGYDGIKGMLWLGAMILSLPMLIAIVRKWQAFGMLVSEMSVTSAAAKENTVPLRGIISTIVFIAGCAGLFLIILVLSSTLLPSRNLLIVLALVLVGLTFLLWRTFVQVHTKAQFALYETLNEAPLPHEHGESPPLPTLLQQAELLNLSIAQDSPAVGKVISELQLRTRTGASIVGIERQGENIINPDISEEIRVGDSILLIGNAGQIERAKLALQ